MTRQPTIAAQVVVVGAGPAGLAAAHAAAESGARVLVLDMMARPGGRVWAEGRSAGCERLVAAADECGVTWRAGVRVVAALQHQLLIEDAEGCRSVSFDRLVVATGARELTLPFPGWTLPGVVAAGGLQLMLKSGLQLKGRRVVLAGSGPLLLAVADTARRAGGRVVCVAEQAPRERVARFALQLRHYPDRSLQALRLRMGLWRTPYRCGTRLLEAHGGPGEWLRSVRLADVNGRVCQLECDLLAVGHSLAPEMQLASLLGCRLREDASGVVTDAFGATSAWGVYAAGEVAGVGGQRKASIEGRIAGLAAVGRMDEAEALLPRAQHERRYAELLLDAFAPRLAESPEWTEDTIVCRCEDVRAAQLTSCQSWREARLQQRCGMGHCQGRLCGSALALHRGWDTAVDVRTPLMPARLSTLACAPSLVSTD